MKIPSIILAAALLLTGTAPIVSTLGVQPAAAQGPPPTAGLVSGRPSFVAGTPATFTGRDFSPGETVTFQITHFDGSPVTAGNHTPATVVADPNGAFAAVWPVCATDCVGQMLRIEATGQTSGKVARVMFMDLPVPPAPGAQGQQARDAGRMAGRRADRARAIPAEAAVAPTFERVKSFGTSGSGAYPYSPLMQGTDGALYGAAYTGGTFGAGTLFKMNQDGTGFTVLKSFDYSTTGGYPFFSRLTQGTDGAIYGAASQGGPSSYGTVFKMNTDGTGFIVLKSFDYSSTGGYLYGGVVQGTDGALYGTASQGGPNIASGSSSLSTGVA